MNASTPRLRAALDAIPAYRPGRPAGPGGSSGKLSSNENPYAPLPGVVAAVAEAATRMNRYPDLACTELAQVVADRLDVAPDQLCFGTGSVGVLQALLQAVGEPETEVVFAWRSFEAYPIVVRLSGAVPVPVPLTGPGHPDGAERHDLVAMAAAVTSRTRLVLLCSPNNPTGTVLGSDEVATFLAAVPPTCLVVLDEAYVEFAEAGAPDGPALLAAHPNLVLLRTFSKAYGLAGLRVGYAVATPTVAQALRKASVPFGVSTVAQAAALASLAAEAELHERVTALVAERSRVVGAWRAAGWDVPPSGGNFFWLRLGEWTEQWAQEAGAAGVVVRPFGGEGVRVTIGEQEANDRLLEACGSRRLGP